VKNNHVCSVLIAAALAACGGDSQKSSPRTGAEMVAEGAGDGSSSAGPVVPTDAGVTTTEIVKTCDDLSQDASSTFEAAIEGAVQCLQDSDCEEFAMPQVCWSTCTTVLAGTAQYSGVVADAIGTVHDACSGFEQKGCQLLAPSCDPQGELLGFVCVDAICSPQYELL
jgi:hypothetical protein